MYKFTSHYVICIALAMQIHFLWGQDASAEVKLSNQLTTFNDSAVSIKEQPPRESGLSLGPAILTPPEDSLDLEDIRKPSLKRISMFGYLRTFVYGRNMTTPYPGLDPFAKAYGVGDGYREPMLSLNVVGRPNGKTTFGTELYIFTPYTGEGFQENTFTMNLGLNLYGNFRTNIGKFGVRTGGIHWYNLSAFTMGAFQVLDRYSIFERTPWEGVSNTDKYDLYHGSGIIDRGDNRWANQAFQGFIAEGSGLPGGFSFAFLYGKTQPNGGFAGGALEPDPLATIINPRNAGNFPNYNGFAGTSPVTPNLFTGGRLAKDFKDGRLAYNVIDSRTYLDSLSDDVRAFQVHTLEFNYKYKGFTLSGEAGAGNFTTPTIDENWGEAVKVKLEIPKEYTFLPLSVQYYQISPDFFNINSEILTFSNPEIQNSTTGQQNLGQAAAGAPMTLVGQLAHNRRGVNLNTEARVGGLYLNIGYGVAREIEALTTQISYDHRINGLALSRIYNPFPAGATGPTVFGPYNRITSYFRGTFETVNTTDVDPATALARVRKSFNTIDIQAKYKTEVLDRKLFLFYLSSIQSAREETGLLPVFQEDTYVFAQYHELDLYFEVFPNFILAGYGGLELIQGGVNTEIDAETLLPRDQIGRAIGVGFDWTLAENAGLYVRQRFMNFEDRNFALDRYIGRETTIELKIYF
ncbi:MAG: hypothetical protein AAGI38_03060 [Bacteroidota bacterium]